MITKNYISEKIGNDYTKWKNESVIISSGTGTGKSRFVYETLIPYAMQNIKNVLYLVNRKKLYDQIKKKIAEYQNTKLLTYQKLQSMIAKKEDICHYDYIICDECHYFIDDAVFNINTDISYDWITSQNNSVIVFMSGTGDTLFTGLRISGKVKANRIYTIEKDYSNIDSVYFYKSNQLINIVQNILENNADDKILFFVNSIKRLKEMFCYFGDTASYLCSKAHEKDDSLSFVDYDCIHNSTFEKRILFVTKTLDNGVDLVDINIKHIFCEIIDIDSAIQAIGRKRCPKDEHHPFSVYFKEYDNRPIRRFADIENENLIP